VARNTAVRPLVTLALLALAGVALPWLTQDSYHLDVATTVAMNLLLTMSLRLQLATGQVNMAHISFMGIGAYASALTVMRLGLSFWVTLLVAPVVAAAFAIPIGLIALRLSGPYYFLVTFAFSEVVRLFFNNFFIELFGGASGLVDIPAPSALFGLTFTDKASQYGLMLTLFLLGALVLVRLDYSRFGLLAGAIRQGELLAATLGVRVLRVKLTAFVIGAACAGLAGAFFAHSHHVLHSSDFGLEPMVLLVAYTVIGGVGSVWGPILGTILLTFTSEALRELRAYETLVYGLVLILTMLFVPDGLVSIPGRLRRAVQRRRAARAGEMGVGVAA
jgi:branched-chain amino acid transport system permease protein